MAITKAYPRLKVEVVVNNIPLEEFDDEDEPVSLNASTKYVESRSGAHFAVKCILTQPWPEHSILLECYLDGVWMRGAYMMQKDFIGNSFERIMDGANYTENDQSFLQRFSFSELTIDDSGSSTVSDSLMKDLKGVGEIKVNAFYVKNLRQTESGLRRKDMDNLNEVPEKALKGRALSHQSSLQPPVATRAVSIWSSDFVDGSKNPFAVFSFRYRSRAALKSLLVIQRSPSPIPLEERDVNTLTPEESRELIRRLRERDEAARAVKREDIKSERGRERSTTITEREIDADDEISFVSSKRRRLPVTIDEDGIETIDLT